MKTSFKISYLIFLSIWSLFVIIVGLSAFVDMDIDKTKSHWCENGLEELDCAYTLRWIFALSLVVSGTFYLASELSEIMSKDVKRGLGVQNE